jgi:hypothetical protein
LLAIAVMPLGLDISTLGKVTLVEILNSCSAVSKFCGLFVFGVLLITQGNGRELVVSENTQK